MHQGISLDQSDLAPSDIFCDLVGGKMLHFAAFFVDFHKLIRPHPVTCLTPIPAFSWRWLIRRWKWCIPNSLPLLHLLVRPRFSYHPLTLATLHLIHTLILPFPHSLLSCVTFLSLSLIHSHPGPSEDIRHPQKCPLGPNWALLGASGVP